MEKDECEQLLILLVDHTRTLAISQVSTKTCVFFIWVMRNTLTNDDSNMGNRPIVLKRYLLFETTTSTVGFLEYFSLSKMCLGHVMCLYAFDKHPYTITGNVNFGIKEVEKKYAFYILHGHLNYGIYR